MSSFSIYKSSKYSFKEIGKLSKLHYYLLIILWIITGVLAPLFLDYKFSDIAHYIFLLTFLLVFTSMAFYTQHIKKNIEIIGDLKVTKSCLIKSIGGLVKRYYYDDIETIKVDKHLRSVFGPLNNDGTETYRLKISHKNGNVEIFIVSSQSCSKPEVNLLTSFTTLEKLRNGNLRIIR